jgi:uncharacterized protein YhaN
VLKLAIERYQKKNETPVLNRAGQLFAQLTCGAFSGLRAELEQGQAVLLGVRPDGQTLVRVDGLSDGTRDQLYLALRLASLETSLALKEPVPFIVDDVLVLFDDDRAAAALAVLAELARRTQVIAFTHHEHVIEIARRCAAPGLVLHSLAATLAPAGS